MAGCLAPVKHRKNTLRASLNLWLIELVVVVAPVEAVEITGFATLCIKFCCGLIVDKKVECRGRL